MQVPSWTLDIKMEGTRNLSENQGTGMEGTRNLRQNQMLS